MNKLTLNGIFASGMVLQQKQENCASGKSIPLSEVKMIFCDKTYTTKSDENGDFQILFTPENVGGPFVMEFKNQEQEITLTDVFVGEVWVSSGQSNAQLQMERMKYSYQEEFELPENQNIRMITIPITWSLDGEKKSVENPTWICASPKNLGEMSGTGYFFAKQLYEKLNVPIGIINASQGGSPISSWMNKSSLEELFEQKVPQVENYLTRLKMYENPDNVKSTQERLAKNQQEWEKLLHENVKLPELNSNDWNNCTIPNDIEFPSAGLVWFKKEINLTKEQIKIYEEKQINLWLGTIVDADLTYVNGVQVGFTAYCYPPRRYSIPKGVLKEGKNTILLLVQKNNNIGRIRFYLDKPYALFSDDVFVIPRTNDSPEVMNEQFSSENSLYIDLKGEWQTKICKKIKNCPEGIFFEWLPTALYNSMLAPCFNHAIRGVLWYQGESDAMRPEQYKFMLEKLIELWRQKFKFAQKDFPFIVMQLPNWSDGNYRFGASLDGGWARIRQSQKSVTQKILNTALAVTIEAGEWNDLHPETKKTCGTRAANQALRMTYEKSEIAKNTEVKSVSFNETENSIEVIFDNEKPLQVISARKNAINISDLDLYGFSITYFDNKNKKVAQNVNAKLVNENTVKIELPKEIKKVCELRYLWEDNPTPVQLFLQNENLPVGPFIWKNC